jgi:hypothetical protein
VYERETDSSREIESMREKKRKYREKQQVQKSNDAHVNE